ncbi:glycosyltransferase [Lysobacter sp. LF1]|uniref:Glycosyltransferase n=1 Tax=Lysobacter stagni TaxID=3045172 RepID=A0ABT6XES5_9GAMM|nr:glycosyltransferase [Lysobacter sp. LF1]MDI9238649.1 glycosyltransferase [Lysobacter sp. LF1]
MNSITPSVSDSSPCGLQISSPPAEWGSGKASASYAMGDGCQGGGASLGKLRVITRDNGAGLSRDLRLVIDALAPHHDVRTMGLGANRAANRIRQWYARAQCAAFGRIDVQLSLERVYAPMLDCARSNLLMPNPEWFQPAWVDLLPRFERVLCKSLHAVPIFEQLGCHAIYTGFTSEDRLDRDVPRKDAFLHIAGRSSAKGTRAVLDAWLHHPEWPRLTVVQCARKARVLAASANIEHRVGYLHDDELRRLQNEHRFHLCPSEIEGFGHYIAEAMSVGAVVLTTDAAPMNELVTHDCGVLLACTAGTRLGLGIRHQVDRATIEAGVQHALSLDARARQRIGDAVRDRFVERDRAFRLRLASVIATGDDWSPARSRTARGSHAPT